MGAGLLTINHKRNLVTDSARCIILIDCLQNGRTINGERYASLLDQFNDELNKKRPHLPKKKVFFHQKNVEYTCIVAIAEMNELCYEFSLSSVILP